MANDYTDYMGPVANRTSYDTKYDWMLNASPEQKRAQFEVWRSQKVSPAFMNVNPALKAGYDTLLQEYFGYEDAVRNTGNLPLPMPSGGGSGVSSGLQRLLDFYGQQQTNVGSRYDDLLARLGRIDTRAGERIAGAYESGIKALERRPMVDYAKRFATTDTAPAVNAFSNYLQSVGITPTISEALQAQQTATGQRAANQQSRFFNRLGAIDEQTRQGQIRALTNAMTQAENARARAAEGYRYKLEQQRSKELADLQEQVLMAQLKYGR